MRKNVSTLKNKLQGEIELRKGSNPVKALFYLNKAVELNEHDESALVARSREVDTFLNSKKFSY